MKSSCGVISSRIPSERWTYLNSIRNCPHKIFNQNILYFSFRNWIACSWWKSNLFTGWCSFLPFCSANTQPARLKSTIYCLEIISSNLLRKLKTDGRFLNTLILLYLFGLFKCITTSSSDITHTCKPFVYIELRRKGENAFSLVTFLQLGVGKWEWEWNKSAYANIMFQDR
jgi:hypothetical protein